MVRVEAEEELDQGDLGCCQTCARCRRDMPKCTVCFVVFLALLKLAIFIPCVMFWGYLICPLLDYVNLTPYVIYGLVFVWQFITAPLFSQDVFQAIYGCVMLYYYMGAVEKALGWRRVFVLMIIEMLISTFLSFCIGAILYFTPGFRNVGYFAMHWYIPVGGPMSLVMFFQVLSIRVYGLTHVSYCCCLLPAWAFVLISYLLCQFMMAFFWFALHYVLIGLIAGYCVPRKFITMLDEDSDDYSVLNSRNEEVRGQYRREEVTPRDPRERDEDAHIEATVVHEFNSNGRHL